MTYFVGRTRELDALEAKYNSKQFEFVVMYGRRRVGKTALIGKFIENKPAIYYQSIESTGELNLRSLSEKINSFKKDKFNVSAYQIQCLSLY